MSLTDFSRTLITRVKITLPFCANSFGVAPCTATGVPCWNTYHTCKDRENFGATTKTYDFCSADADIPFPGPRPYVKSVTYLPTEIGGNLTKTGRVKVEFADEPDSDVGIDPYVTQRALFPAIPGTFFRKLIARNPNYKGGVMEISEGTLGDAEEAFTKKAHVLLETGKVGKGTFTFESVDLLAGLGEIEVPKKVNLKLLGAINDAVTEMILADTSDAATVAASGYVRIGDEVVQYANYDSAQRRLYNCTRHAFGTAPAGHSANDAVQPCRYFAPGNPFDHLKAMLLDDAAYDAALVDSAAFDAWRDWPGGEVNMSALIHEPTKLNEIYMGLVNLLDCKSWVAEDLKLTIARNIPNAPGRSYRELSDAESIIKASASVDLNEESRKTRSVLYWEKSALGKDGEAGSYSRIDVGVNAEAETEYGDNQQETIYTPWVTNAGIQDEVLAAWISDTLLRRMFGRRDAAPIVKGALDPKDHAVRTGEFATLTTDEILNPDGTPVTTRFQVVKRDAKGSKIECQFQRMPVRRAMFYADEAAADYDSATPAQQEYGGFYCDEATGKMPNGDDGFFYY